MPDNNNNNNNNNKKPFRIPHINEPNDPILALKNQIKNTISLKKIYYLPKQCDMLIVGGGLVGSFIAYWLKTIAPSLSVVVLERDNLYRQSSSKLSVGGHRQQFSLVENIKMSLFGIEFLQKAKEHLKLSNDGPPVDLDYNHDGYLFLATKKTSDILYSNHKIQLLITTFLS
jgi:hypothetical protein